MTGWVRFQLPQALRRAAAWRVRVGAAAGQPGDLIDAAPGDNLVRVDVFLLLPPAQVAARMELTVSVASGRVTDIRLPVAMLKAAGVE